MGISLFHVSSKKLRGKRKASAFLDLLLENDEEKT